MRVLVDDRTEGLPIQMVDYAERRLERLSRHYDRIAEVEVEFERESARGAGWLVQITVRTDGRRHALAYARETAADARSALDVAVARIDRQVVKLKEKIKIEPKRAAAAGVAHLQSEEEAAGGEPEAQIE